MDAARPEPFAGAGRRPRQSTRAKRDHPAQGHAHRNLLRPQRPRGADAFHGPQESPERVRPGGGRGMAVSAQRSRLSGGRRRNTALPTGGFPRPLRAGPPGQLDLDGCHRFRHSGGRGCGARRKRHPRATPGSPHRSARGAAAGGTFSGGRGAPHAVRNADHHRRSGAGIYAAIGRGTHFPASGAHLLLCPDRRFGVCPHLGAGSVRGPVPAEARQARGAALGRTAAGRLSAIFVMAARAQGEGSRRGICPAGAGGADAHASRHRVPARAG